MALLLVGCAAPPTAPAPVVTRPGPSAAAPAPAEPAAAPGDDTGPLPAPVSRQKARWTPVRWAELPGFQDDRLYDAWNAWIKSCERPQPPFAALCGEARRQSLSDEAGQRRWLMSRFQPWRVEPLDGPGDGLLTGYYEPQFLASRTRQPGYEVPLYRPPAGLAARRPWFTRQEMETSPEALAALRGREIVWLADPIDALILQIQGSGRVKVREPDGSERLVRMAFAATNEQPYKSVGRWLLDRGAVSDVSWRGIRDWAARNPGQLRDMLWANPRVAFFREEPLEGLDAVFGPRGAQGVALTPGRSIAVEAGSMPWGTPVWLASDGPVLKLQRLVLAQDTGTAIVGAVRADYFAGWGDEAGEIAARMKQRLRLWVLWPK